MSLASLAMSDQFSPCQVGKVYQPSQLNTVSCNHIFSANEKLTNCNQRKTLADQPFHEFVMVGVGVEKGGRKGVRTSIKSTTITASLIHQ